MPISEDRIEDEGGRFYRVPDWLLEEHGITKQLWLPSVSTILEVYQRPGLMYWYGKVGLEQALDIRDSTAQIGSLVHDVIERIIEGEHISDEEWQHFNPHVKQSIRAYVRWIQVSQFQPVMAEQTVYSLKYGFAGTLDAVGYFGEKKRIGLADWKTSSAFWKVNFLQIAAYRVAYHEMYPENKPLREIHCARFDRDDGNFEDHPLSLKEARTAFTCFIALKRVWDYLKARRDNDREALTVRATNIGG